MYPIYPKTTLFQNIQYIYLHNIFIFTKYTNNKSNNWKNDIFEFMKSYNINSSRIIIREDGTKPQINEIITYHHMLLPFPGSDD